MIFGHLFQLGLDPVTNIHPAVAAGVETATRWRVDGAGDIALQKKAFLFLFGIRKRGGGQEGFRVRTFIVHSFAQRPKTET